MVKMRCNQIQKSLYCCAQPVSVKCHDLEWLLSEPNQSNKLYTHTLHCHSRPLWRCCVPPSKCGKSSLFTQPRWARVKLQGLSGYLLWFCEGSCLIGLIYWTPIFMVGNSFILCSHFHYRLFWSIFPKNY